jgi:mycothiol synthase
VPVRITELSETPDDQARRDALAFVRRVEDATGRPALSDHLRMDLADHAGSPGSLLATVADDGTLIALAQVSAANDTALLEVVVDPATDAAAEVRDDVAETIVAAHRQRSERPIVWWLDDPTDRDRAVADGFGLVPWRELFEMRRPLPHPEHATVTTRAFRPDLDDEAWVRVNNRAFAGHPEQGGWTDDTLRLRREESWFDPEGFRIHEIDGSIAAFCWTKLHSESDPVVGEIYVIAVDPAFHGRGLGRELTLAGLDSIAARGVTLANLYVDAANQPAVALYRQLGFDVHRRRLAFAPEELTR